MGLYYRDGSQYIYNLGGSETMCDKFSKFAMRFDLINCKWKILPSMIHERYASGCFAT